MKHLLTILFISFSFIAFGQRLVGSKATSGSNVFYQVLEEADIPTLHFNKLNGSLTANLTINGAFNVDIGPLFSSTLLRFRTVAPTINLFQSAGTNAITLDASGINIGYSSKAAGQLLSIGSGGTYLSGISAGTSSQALIGTGTAWQAGQINLSSMVTNRLPLANFRQGTSLSVLGRYTSPSGDYDDITATTDGTILRRSGTDIGFGAIDLANANAVTGDLPLINLPVLSTVTPDPTSIVSTGDSFDTWANKTAGNFQSILGQYSLPTVTGLNNKIVVDGNSQTKNVGTVTLDEAYPQVARDILGSTGAGYAFNNQGFSGQTSSQMYTNRASIGALFDGTKSTNFLWAWEIENDALTYTSPTDLFTHITDYYTYQKGVGYKVIAATSPQNGTLTPVQNKAIRDANVLLRADPTKYDYLVDTDSLPLWSNPKAQSGFQSDKTHGNDGAMKQMADAFVTKTRLHLGQTDYTPPNFVSWSGNFPDRAMTIGSRNDNSLGLMTNGKIHAEVRTNGTTAIVPDVTASSGFSRALYINSGHTFSADGDIASALAVQPAYYYNPGSYAATQEVIANFMNTSGTSMAKFFNSGKQTHDFGSYTAPTNSETMYLFQGTGTGFNATSSFGIMSIGNLSQAFTFNSNNTSYGAMNVIANTTEGAFTGGSTTVMTLRNVSPTTSDFGIKQFMASGTGYSHTDHTTGNATAFQITSTAPAAAMTVTAADFGMLLQRTAGTEGIARFIHSTSSNLSAPQLMFEIRRNPSAAAIGNGGGSRIGFAMNRSDNNSVTSGRIENLWISNTAGSETSSLVFSNVVSAAVTEGMRLNGTSLGVGGVTPTSTIHSAGSFSTGYVAKTGAYTLTISDHTVEVTSGTHTQTLPTAVGIAGRIYVITNSGSGVVTVGTTSSQTFANVTLTPTTLTLNQFQTVMVQSNGANWLRLTSL